MSQRKRVILVGHCGPDCSHLVFVVRRVRQDADVVAVDDEQTLESELRQGADLLLLNRVLEYGFAGQQGVDLIRRLRRAHPGLRMMLVSNFPDAQAAAVAEGALPGFGKREMGQKHVQEAIASALA